MEKRQKKTSKLKLTRNTKKIRKTRIPKKQENRK